MHAAIDDIAFRFEFLIAAAPLKGPPLPLFCGQILSWKEEVYEIVSHLWVTTGQRSIRGRVIELRSGRNPAHIIVVLDARGKNASEILGIERVSSEGAPLVERREQFLNDVYEYHDELSVRLYELKRDFAFRNGVSEERVKVLFERTADTRVSA